MKPKHFLFIPGSFHGAWCWFKMMPLLNSDGNSSVALDLPAHGRDKTPISEITLDSYVNSVCKELEKSSQPVILVGHSRAGIILSQVAEKIPDKIDQLVYLCAYLIPNRENMVTTALSDAESLLGPNLIFNEQEGWHIPKEEWMQAALYNDCSAEDIALSKCLLTPEPNLPVVTPLNLSDKNYGRVKKNYIETILDQAISNKSQHQMLDRIKVERVYKLESSHSPFLSKPRELAEILLHLD